MIVPAPELGEFMWKRLDNGEPVDIRNAPAGAMWDADWYHAVNEWCGPDVKALIVRVPNGEWHIDGRASNCDMTCRHCGVIYSKHKGTDGDGKRIEGCDNFEDATPHKCWVRHGVPPEITVDKNGVTCGAGGGSIQTKEYHGFLRNGYLVNC